MKFGITKGVDTRGALQSQQNFWCASRVGFPLTFPPPPPSIGHVARLTVLHDVITNTGAEGGACLPATTPRNMKRKSALVGSASSWTGKSGLCI